MSRFNHNHYNNRRRTRSSSEFHEPNDQCKIINGTSTFRNRNHWSKVYTSFNRFRDNKIFCDVTIKVGEKSYDCHRLILAAASPYFEAMFTSDLQEKNQPFIQIHDCSDKIFQLLFDYIYRGEIVVTQDNVQELLSAANMFELSEIVSYACKFLQKQLDPSNCVGIYRFAEFHSCTMFRLETKRYIERHFAEVMKEEEFFDLPKDILKNFLRSEGLSIDNEFQVLEATMQWIQKDVPNRKKHFAELMDCVRIPVISIKKLESFVVDCEDDELRDELDKLIHNHKEAICLFEANKKKNLLENENISMSGNGYSDVRRQPRMCARKSVYVIGGSNLSGHRWNDGKSISSSERLDVLKRQWKSLASMEYARNCHGIAVHNGFIYVAGGENDSLLYDSLEIYDPFEKEWRKGSPLKQPRSCFGMCSHNNHIYALGGWIGNVVGNSIERYDPNKNEWHLYGKMPDVRYAMGVVSFEGLIYIIGGLDEHNCALTSVYSYNPVTCQFQKLANLLHPRAFFGFTILHGQIYVAGGTSDGTNAIHSVERYNIAENVWTFVNNMKMARIAPCAAAVNDLLLIIGGRTPGDEYHLPISLDSVEIYDPESNQWSDSISIATSRCEAAVAVI